MKSRHSWILMEKKPNQNTTEQKTEHNWKNFALQSGIWNFSGTTWKFGSISTCTNINSTKQIRATPHRKTTEATGHTNFWTCTKWHNQKKHLQKILSTRQQLMISIISFLPNKARGKLQLSHSNHKLSTLSATSFCLNIQSCLLFKFIATKLNLSLFL